MWEAREAEDEDVNAEQLQKMASAPGFIAALDQSGGSTPKALKLYGSTRPRTPARRRCSTWIHEMRTRIITSPAFTGDRILGRDPVRDDDGPPDRGHGLPPSTCGRSSTSCPFLKVDKGLAEEADGAQVMKPMPDLDDLLARAIGHGVFGTKMRSVIKLADPAGVEAVVAQQFEIGRQILAAGLVPIIEPEVDIHSPQKAEAEDLLKAALLGRARRSSRRPAGDAQAHAAGAGRLLRRARRAPARCCGSWRCPAATRRDEANARLARNHGVVASFSRALTEGLTAQQSEAEFDAALDAAIASIYAASIT